jgi:hypothetical protein
LKTNIETTVLSGSLLSLDGFLGNFHIYCELFRRLETSEEITVPNDTLSVGEELGLGTKSWTQRGLEDLLRRKHLHHFFPKVDGTPDLEKQLTHAFRIQEDKSRIETLCDTGYRTCVGFSST